MLFGKNNKIDRVWSNICKYDGETFYTIRRIGFTYVVVDDYILINNDKRRRITKVNIAKALEIVNPIPSKINFWGNCYIYGIITDSRIK